MGRTTSLRLDGEKPSGGGALGGVNSFRGANDGVPFLHAVVVAEPYQPSSGFLSPVTPHKELPFALLPICNTPLIDYILENLMENHVDMVTVLVRENDEAIRNHLEKNATVVGQTWMKRGSLAVKAILPPHGCITLYSACSCIVTENVVAQGGSILLFPVNAITAFTDLRRLFQLHSQRAEKIPQYTATVLCTPTGETLRAAFHNVLESVCGPDMDESEEEHHSRSAGSGVEGVAIGEANGDSSHHVGGDAHHHHHHHHHGTEGDHHEDDDDRRRRGGILGGSAGLRGRARAIPTFPKDYHTILAFDEETEVVSHMARFEVQKEDEIEEDEEEESDLDTQRSQRSPSDDGRSGWGGEPAKIVFTKATQCVRMDLIPTNYMFLCVNALPLVKAGAEDVHNFLNEILATVEVTGNCFGFMEMPRVSGMIETITTMDSFIRANLDVCGRRFYPMTRESCFAEPQLSYEVAPWCETVYLHTTSRAPPGGAGVFYSSYTNRITSRRQDGRSWERMMGPYAVLGPHVSLPADTYHFCGVSCDQNVIVGNECSLVGCVIMSGAKIGARCQLRYVIVGKNAVIEDDMTLVNCMVEHGAVVSRARCGGNQPGKPTSSPTSNNPIRCYRDGDGVVELCSLKNHRNHSPTVGSPTSSSTGSSPQQSSSGAFSPLVCPLTRLRIQNMIIMKENHHDSSDDDSDDIPNKLPLKELPVGNVLPTEALFIDDPLPQSDEDEENVVDNDRENIFYKIVRNGVRSAYMEPYSLSARRVELTTACVSYGVPYPQLCRVVTRSLIRHMANTVKEMDEEEEIINVARPLLKRWMKEFYEYILINNSQEHQSMLFLLEGLCEGIVDDECNLFWHIPALIDLLYDGCDRDTFVSRGYCLVASTALTAFLHNYKNAEDDSDDTDSDDTEDEVEDVESESENVYDLPASQACAKHIEQTLIPRIREKMAKFNFFGGDDDSDDDSSDDE